MPYTITSNPDDTVTLEAAGVAVVVRSVHGKGDIAWREANATAHLLGEAYEVRDELARARAALQAATGRLRDVADMLKGVEASLRLR